MTDQQPPATHTVGPWKASGLPEGRCFEVETADGAFYIGSCPFGDPSVEPEVPSFLEARANARMFASAPALAAENARLIALVGEMREALKRLTNAASEVHTLGAVTGSQWARLTGPLIQARAASKAGVS